MEGKNIHDQRKICQRGLSKNERKFMMCTGGGIAVLGVDLLILGILETVHPVSEETALIILSIGIVLFVSVILVGQKYFRR